MSDETRRIDYPEFERYAAPLLAEIRELRTENERLRARIAAVEQVLHGWPTGHASVQMIRDALLDDQKQAAAHRG